MKHLNGNKVALHPEPIYFQAERDSVLCEIAMQYNDSYVENIFAFATTSTPPRRHPSRRLQGGADARRQHYAQKNNLLKNEKMQITGEDVRGRPGRRHQRQTAGTAVRGPYEDEVGNSEVKGLVESIVRPGGRVPRAEPSRWRAGHREKTLAAARSREAARKARELTRRKSASTRRPCRQARGLPEP